MNRRTFCLSLVATACGGGEQKRRRRRRRPPPDAGYDGPVYINRITPFATQRRRSELELHGNTLAQARPDGIVLWDALSMKPLTTHTLRFHSFCFMRDGSLALFSAPPGSGRCVVHRLDRSGRMRALEGPSYSTEYGYILPAFTGPTGDYYYVLRRDDILVLEEMYGRVEAKARLDLPGGSVPPRLVYSLDDGRIVIGGKRIYILERNNSVQTYQMSHEPTHIAAMPGERCWYSFAPPDDRIDTLELTSITAPTQIERRVTFPREHVVHMASAPDGNVAVLVFWLDEREKTFDEAVRWSVLVLDPQGRERWRVEVPRVHLAGKSIALNRTGCVVISEQRVILRGLRDTLFAWETATGAPVRLHVQA